MDDYNRRNAFCCVISSHLSSSRISFINKVWTLSRKINPDNLTHVHILVDKELKRHKEETLSELYRLILNNEMSVNFPEVKDIMLLRLSDMNKCILLMSILGFQANEIANLLFSTTHSIQTMMLNIRKRYPVYAKHLTK